MAVGTCTQSVAAPIANHKGATDITKITFTCVGGTGAEAGTIPDTATNAFNTSFIKGKYLFAVKSYPTPDGTAPDAADVTVVTATGRDLLGGKGVNLIHATLEQSCTPYNAFTGAWEYPVADGALTLKVANQATESADFTIELIFVK